jgi:hypothetical protein
MLHLADLPIEIVYKIVDYLDAKSLNNVCDSSEKALLNFHQCRIILAESLLKKVTNNIRIFLLNLSQKMLISATSKSCWRNIKVMIKYQISFNTDEIFEIDGLDGYIKQPKEIIWGFKNLDQMMCYSHINEYQPKHAIEMKKRHITKRLNVDDTLSKIWKKISKTKRKDILIKIRKTPLKIKSLQYDTKPESSYPNGYC